MGVLRVKGQTHDLDVDPDTSLLPVSAATGREITTIEGMDSHGELHPVPKAWLAPDVPPCDCHRGVIMAVAALLKTKPKPTDADIDAIITNICRCGAYQRIRAAIHSVAG